MPEERDDSERVAPAARGRRSMICPSCGAPMRFDGGASTHDLFAERFVCARCGRVEYRSYGRGSV